MTVLDQLIQQTTSVDYLNLILGWAHAHPTGAGLLVLLVGSLLCVACEQGEQNDSKKKQAKLSTLMLWMQVLLSNTWKAR